MISTNPIPCPVGLGRPENARPTWPESAARPISEFSQLNCSSGKYFPLYEMTEAAQDQLIADHFLFDKPVSPLLTCAGMARDWPDGRGIWHNDEKNFLVSILWRHHFVWLEPFILPQNTCMCILVEFKKGILRWSFDMDEGESVSLSFVHDHNIFNRVYESWISWTKFFAKRASVSDGWSNLCDFLYLK